jgi:thiol-disulfide isomerase/thioredoxin
MTSPRIALAGFVVVASLLVTRSAAPKEPAAPSSVQDDPALTKPKVVVPPAASLRAINEDYARQLLQLERQRLDRLAQLAARQAPQEAAETYEQLFRLAIANNLFSEAEAPARLVLKSAHDGCPPIIQFLARTIDIIASADRGAIDESVAELRTVFLENGKPQRNGELAANSLDTPALVAICEAYYQRLLQGDNFDAARKAFQLLLKEAENPVIKNFSASRLAQLELVGKPAPPIQGTDLDGKSVRLDEMKGKVVLVVFWASWCLPSSTEAATLDQVYTAYQARGFRILGINVDTMQTDGPKLEILLPNIRRFLLDNNVRWPNLVNGTGPQDYAKAYGVTAIPSNVLVGREGTIIHLDLSPNKNLASAVAKALGP